MVASGCATRLSPAWLYVGATVGRDHRPAVAFAHRAERDGMRLAGLPPAGRQKNLRHFAHRPPEAPAIEKAVHGVHGAKGPSIEGTRPPGRRHSGWHLL